MPRRGANQKVTATIASQLITIGGGSKSIRVLNAGTVVAYFVTYKASDETIVCTNAQSAVGPAADGD